jgi:preprotein translocase subunit SecB
VVLTVSITARNADATAFVVEVKQAGVFGMRNLSEADYRRAIGSVAPNVLFPYARAIIAQLVALGGFPQMLLPPVNFDALYARSLAESQQQETPPASLNS